MPRTIPLALAALLSLGAVKPAAAQEVFLGQIIMMGTYNGDWCPRGFAKTDGQLVPISQNAALFSILGTAYGGDGRTTFAMPKLSMRDENGAAVLYCIATRGTFPSRP